LSAASQRIKVCRLGLICFFDLPEGAGDSFNALVANNVNDILVSKDDN